MFFGNCYAASSILTTHLSCLVFLHLHLWPQKSCMYLTDKQEVSTQQSDPTQHRDHQRKQENRLTFASTFKQEFAQSKRLLI